MTESELRELLAQPEGQSLEFGQFGGDILGDIGKKLNAFANTNDGLLIIGINPKTRDIVGLNEPLQKAEERLVGVRNSCEPSPRLEWDPVTTHDEKTVLIVHVRENATRDKPCYLQRGPGAPRLCHVRVGSTVRLATILEERRMLQASGSLSFEQSPVWEATYADLDESKITAYLTLRSPAGVIANGRSVAQLIRAIDLPLFYREEGDEQPNIACVLMFARQPQRFLPQSKVSAMQFAGLAMGDSFLQRKVFSGTADDLIDVAEAFVRQGLVVSAVIPPTGTTRQEREPLPGYVIREAIVNAVMHRDYSLTGAEISVRLFGDRLEVESPGGLPDGLTLADLEHSVARNPILGGLLSELGKVDRIGSGINRMRRAMREHGCEPPQFWTDGRWFRVTLYAKRELPLYKSSLTIRSASATPWHADTLFGHFCWFLLRHHGEGRLREFLGRYEDGHPPILLSDGFPGDYLPRPLLPRAAAHSRLPKAQRLEQQRAEKKTTHAAWLTLDEFNRVRRGEAVVPSLTEAEIEGATRLHVTTKNQINRITNTAGGDGGELYDMEEFLVPHVTIYWRIEDGGYLDMVSDFLTDLQATGYGKRKSVGYGQVESFKPEEFNGFDDVPDANGFVSLSRFVPAPNDPTDGFWSTNVKYGKLGEEFAIGGYPFKRPLVQLACGSCFRAAQPKEWYGRLVDGLSDQHPEAKQYGFAFALPMKLPN